MKLSFDEAIEHIVRIASTVNLPLIAIEGLPCAGKSTFTERLQDALGLECIYLDDFVLPKSDWPSHIVPAFPFEYIRYNDFLQTVSTLAATGQCSYAPFD